jgi:hypothetical protein
MRVASTEDKGHPNRNTGSAARTDKHEIACTGGSTVFPRYYRNRTNTYRRGSTNPTEPYTEFPRIGIDASATCEPFPTAEKK